MYPSNHVLPHGADAVTAGAQASRQPAEPPWRGAPGGRISGGDQLRRPRRLERHRPLVRLLRRVHGAYGGGRRTSGAEGTRHELIYVNTLKKIVFVYFNHVYSSILY